jgi:hypothetical protein
MPGDEPPPVGSGDDQRTAVEPVVQAPSELPTQAAPLGTRLPPAAPPAVQLPPPLPPAQPAFSGAASAASERPEIAVGGAFAGGLVLALILKRLAR